MKLSGTCQSQVRGLEGPAAFECDPETHEIAVFFWVADLLKPMEMGVKGALLKRPVRLHDIELASHTARFRIDKLPPAFFSSMRVGGWSIDDGQIDRLLDLNNNNTDVLKLGVTLKTGKLTLVVVDSPREIPLSEELVISNHSRYMAREFSVVLGKRTFDVRYASKRLFVSGRITQSSREIFQHTASLLALTAESIVSHLRPPKFVLYMYVSEPRGYGEEVVPKSDLASVFRRVAKRLLRMPNEERNRTYNEITYVVSGFEQSRLIEERLTSLFKALESFDNCKTLSPQGCSALLGITRDDAHYLCQVRNKLIHNGMTLAEAGVAAFNDLKSRPRVKLQMFADIRARRDLPWKLYVTFARLITAAFFVHLGVTQPVRVFSKEKAY